MSFVKLIGWLRQPAGHLVLPLLDATGNITGLHTHRFGPPDSGYLDVVQAWHLNHAVAARVADHLELDASKWPTPPLHVAKGPLHEVLRVLWSDFIPDGVGGSGGS